MITGSKKSPFCHFLARFWPKNGSVFGPKKGVFFRHPVFRDYAVVRSVFGSKNGQKKCCFWGSKTGQKRVKNRPGPSSPGPRGPGQKPLKSAKFSPFFDPLFREFIWAYSAFLGKKGVKKAPKKPQKSPNFTPLLNRSPLEPDPLF